MLMFLSIYNLQVIQIGDTCRFPFTGLIVNCYSMVEKPIFQGLLCIPHIWRWTIDIHKQKGINMRYCQVRSHQTPQVKVKKLKKHTYLIFVGGGAQNILPFLTRGLSPPAPPKTTSLIVYCIPTVLIVNPSTVLECHLLTKQFLSTDVIPLHSIKHHVNKTLIFYKKPQCQFLKLEKLQQEIFCEQKELINFSNVLMVYPHITYDMSPQLNQYRWYPSQILIIL